MSGRVVDMTVNPRNSIEFYVAYASGGLWYTNNNGTSFTPVLDSAEMVNCGSVTLDFPFGTKDSSRISTNVFDEILCCFFLRCFHTISKLIIFENTLLVLN